MSVFNNESLDFHFHYLEDTLPLDVLLELCKKGKVDIKDIFLSDITEQYMGYVTSLPQRDYDNISSFLLLASTLLEFKSNSILPKIVFEEETDEIGEEELFLMRLEEYSLLKEAAEKMGKNEILNRFYRDPVFDEKEYKLVIKDFNLDKMIAAFTILMERVEFADNLAGTTKIIKNQFEERFTIADRILDIVETLRAEKVISFFSLFDKDFSKIDIINTFLALLEVLKQQIATATQQGGIYGDILIKHAPLTDKFGDNQEELLTNVDEYN